MGEPKWRIGYEKNNDHWLYGELEAATTGIVRLSGVWHIWTPDPAAYGAWIPHPEYADLPVEEMKAIALVISRMESS